jgi:hypothetical protein
MQHHMVCQKFTSVSEEPTASISGLEALFSYFGLFANNFIGL